jgi:ATP-dependent DNA ligase
MIASPHGAVNAKIRGLLPDFFAVASAHDLEGIVAKPATGRYHADGTSTSWVKIKNPRCTQATGRHELFDRRTTTLSHKRAPVLRLS